MPKEEIDRQRVKEAAGILELQELLHRKPHESVRRPGASGSPWDGPLSAARRSTCSTKPLSNLDAKLRTQMRLEIKQLHQQVENTIIYVTHDQVEAMTLADRIVVMRGRLYRAGRQSAGNFPETGPIHLWPGLSARHP